MGIAQQEVSEIARERETFKYDALTISTAGLRGPHPPKSIPSVFLSSTPDPGLTAFAQLGLFKLDASRSMISLFDRKYQHIVAEALRPEHGQRDNREDQNWFNGLAFERLTSVCEHVVTGKALAQSIPGTEHGLGVADIPVSIIEHLDGDRRFCHIRDSQRQFYAGVPIRSPAGINIGVYCVFDSKPRLGGLNVEEVRFMRDMSKVIMDYLESKRSHECYRREQRIVRGMGGLINGEATLWKEDESASSVAPALRDMAGLSEGLLNKRLQSTSTTTGDPQQTAQKMDPDQELPISYEVPAIFGGNDNQGPENRVTSPQQSTQTLSPPVIDKAVDIEPTTEASRTTPAAIAVETPAVKSRSRPIGSLRSEIEHDFSRAANVIREAFEVQGVLFLDASIRSYGALITNISSDTEPSSSGPSGSSGDDGQRSPTASFTTRSASVCDVLGFSKTSGSSILGDEVPKEFKECKEWFLHRLLRRHPRGRTWNFEADGTLCDPAASSDSDLSPAESLEAQLPALRGTDKTYVDGRGAPKSSKKSMSAAARIIKMFPGARSVAMIPLWDAQTGRVYAGGFMWTKTPTRTLSEETELSCLRVFALTVMADVARLKLQSAEEAKTDILGSISHELRSPLHGLVGAVELLKDTSLDTVQDGILSAIESSGRTLLDTIEHLLDYVKTNPKKSSKTRRRGSIDARQRLSSTTAPPVQLDLLVEEVVESVLAGYKHLARSQTHSSIPFTSLTPQRAGAPKALHVLTDDRLATESPSGAVRCSLDIDHSAKWAFRMHPGAFRRIVMNLFGNSLKFTTSGYIHVSLRQESQRDDKNGPGTTRVVFSVSDSGKGMTEAFLRNSLFTPFSQEDQFAVGTGLGLSLVRETTQACGGTIDVSSKAGTGTTVTVKLPLFPVSEQASDNDETGFWQDAKSLAGQRIQLCDYERGAMTRDASDGSGKKRKSQHQLLEDILHWSAKDIPVSIYDNQINLKVMAAYLAKLKFTCITATNGLEALNLYASDPAKYSCVLTDISMPIMDGLESTRRIRELEHSNGHKPVVVIALTGLDGAGVRQDALASGVDLFLSRPLTISGLQKALLAMGLG
ncbi:hypothetical protein KJ359_010165 [Pestalotiopsis sp. 9143b]|nr:hypothetical protein KJ359_010165 [Pestalotiopsis sp. 9143b]